MDKQETLRLKRLHTGDKVELPELPNLRGRLATLFNSRGKERLKKAKDEQDKKDREQLGVDEDTSIPGINTESELLTSIKEWIENKTKDDEATTRRGQLRGIRNGFTKLLTQESTRQNVLILLTAEYRKDPFRYSTSNLIFELQQVSPTLFRSLQNTSNVTQNIGTNYDRFMSALKQPGIDMDLVNMAFKQYIDNPQNTDSDKIKAYKQYINMPSKNDDSIKYLKDYIETKIIDYAIQIEELRQEAQTLVGKLDQADNLTELNNKITKLRQQQVQITKEYTSISKGSSLSSRLLKSLGYSSSPRSDVLGSSMSSSSSNGDVLGSSMSSRLLKSLGYSRSSSGDALGSSNRI